VLSAILTKVNLTLKAQLFWQAVLKEMQGTDGAEQGSPTFLHNTGCSPRWSHYKTSA